MDYYIILGLQIVLLTVVSFGMSYVRQLPKTIQEKTLKIFQHELNQQVERFKIQQGDLHVFKRQEYQKHNKFWTDMLIRKKKVDVNKLADIGLNLFFYASDEVLSKFVEMRKFFLDNDPEVEGYGKQGIILMAELNLLMRKDLGYDNTNISIDDYLNILLKDWGEYSKR